MWVSIALTGRMTRTIKTDPVRFGMEAAQVLQIEALVNRIDQLLFVTPAMEVRFGVLPLFLVLCGI